MAATVATTSNSLLVGNYLADELFNQMIKRTMLTQQAINGRKCGLHLLSPERKNAILVKQAP